MAGKRQVCDARQPLARYAVGHGLPAAPPASFTVFRYGSHSTEPGDRSVCLFHRDRVTLVNTMANGEATEVGTIGNEGVVGLPLLLGDDRAPTSVYVQVPGAGLRMNAAVFKKELARSASMRKVMLRYAHALFNQVAQSAACNHSHSIQQRCCRWMLMTYDRMQSDKFLLTQEFLAMMLGVQRTGVSAAAGALQRAGLIRYRRGIVTILDRRGLKRRSCECYGISKREFDQLLGV
jgi:CRP-like cAMP-binding protein